MICLLLAILCAILSIIIYAAMQGTAALVVTLIAGLTAVPPILYLFGDA